MCYAVVSQEMYPRQLSGARGAGVFCAVDVCTPSHRDELLNALRAKGEVHVVVKKQQPRVVVMEIRFCLVYRVWTGCKMV